MGQGVRKYTRGARISSGGSHIDIGARQRIYPLGAVAAPAPRRDVGPLARPQLSARMPVRREDGHAVRAALLPTALRNGPLQRARSARRPACPGPLLEP
eukprot:744490-Rhodomonas_salina.1